MLTDIGRSCGILNKKGHPLPLIFKIAFAYVGTVVGAGFASGQEVLRFFTMYGHNSIWAIIISTLLFIYIGKRILLLGYDLGAISIGSINKKVFRNMSPIVTGYLIISMIIICTAMLAGSGALFYEYYDIDGQIGILITALLAIVVMLFGVKGILSANSIIVPVLIVFNIIIFAFALFNPNILQKESAFVTGTIGNVIRSGISYAAFNIVLSSGVLAPIGSEIDNPKILVAGGILGGAILGGMLAASDYCLRVHIPYIYDYEIPMLFVIKHMNSNVSKLYAPVLWGSIFTTLIGNLFTIISITSEKTNLSPLISSLIVLGCAYTLSFFGFSEIVSIFYPILGLIGIVFMILLMAASVIVLRN